MLKKYQTTCTAFDLTLMLNMPQKRIPMEWGPMLDRWVTAASWRRYWCLPIGPSSFERPAADFRVWLAWAQVVTSREPVLLLVLWLLLLLGKPKHIPATTAKHRKRNNKHSYPDVVTLCTPREAHEFIGVGCDWISNH